MGCNFSVWGLRFREWTNPREGQGRLSGTVPGTVGLRGYGSGVPNRGGRVRAGGPRAYLTSKGSWPNGPIRKDSPVATAWAAEFSRRLGESLAGRSKSAVAEEAGLARSTIYDLLTGETWPDLVTISVLEDVLDTELLPRWPRGAAHPSK